MNTSEYQDKYSGAGGRRGGGGGGGGGGGAGGSGSGEVAPIKANEDQQPVGGKSQARAAAAAAAFAQRSARGGQGFPAVDESFVATVYSESERGTHRSEPGWRDPRWSNDTRAANSTLYETSERDPPHRQQLYVYKSTLVDALNTPCQPMPAPDVHKLRYMHNNYMTCDDWY